MDADSVDTRESEGASAVSSGEAGSEEAGLWWWAVMTITRPADLDPVTAAVNEAIGWVRQERASGRIGVACSGGADSIALAHATIAAMGASATGVGAATDGANGAERVVVIHIDHQLSAGSGTVAESVASWARGQGATAIVRSVVVEDRASVEAAARDARYAALADIADELELAAIFVGHTARDQAETVLMRILRGTGPAGLVGIPRVRLAHEQRCGDDPVPGGPVGRASQIAHESGGHAASDAPWIVRPLLAVSRDAIDVYVVTNALPTWDDPMNHDRSLFRVRVREQLLPALRAENPQLDAALTRLASNAAEWLEAIDGLAAPFARTPIDCKALAQQPIAVRKRAVAIILERAGVDYEAVHLDAIDRLVLRPSAGQVAIDLPDARIVRTYDLLALADEPVDTNMVDSATEVDGRRAVPLVAPAGYVLRLWQPGDRMRPRRLGGRSRKLSDLFIDAKVPRDVRSRARVAVRADGVIVWAEHLGLAHGEAENVVPRPPE